MKTVSEVVTDAVAERLNEIIDPMEAVMPNFALDRLEQDVRSEMKNIKETALASDPRELTFRRGKVQMATLEWVLARIEVRRKEEEG